MTFGVRQAIGIDPRAVYGPANSIVTRGQHATPWLDASLR